MLIQILTHTPTWVFVLFGVLILLGLNQTRSRTASVSRVTILPLVMVALSIRGLTQAFDHPFAYAGWVTACGVSLTLWLQFAPQRNAHYDIAASRFTLPGSWLPLILVCGVFMTRYTVGVMIAMHPELRSTLPFAVACASLYGAMSGLFMARTLQLWQIARRAHLLAHA